MSPLAGGRLRILNLLAWGSVPVYAALATTGIVLLAKTPTELIPAADDAAPVAGEIQFAAVLLVYVSVGALVAARRPSNPIGWLLCAMALLNGLYFLGGGWARFSLLADPGALPAPAALGLVSDVAADLQWGLFLALLLLFPDGRLPSTRWRMAAGLLALMALLQLVGTVLTPGPLRSFSSVANPLGVEGAAFLRDVDLGIVQSTWLFAGVAALAARWRAGGAEQRQQLKGFLLALALVTLAIMGLGVAQAATELGPGAELALGLIIVALFGNLGVSLGVAVLKHRLYDIDVAINRTLVYGALTATLVGAYVGSVLLLQLALGPLTEQSDLAIAGSTLAVAGLVRPARRHIQALVDRRFYRHRYDAQQTLEGFGGRLRDEVHLDALAAELRGVVTQTMQPTHVSLWIRSP